MYYAPPYAGFCKAKLACLCILKKRGINPSNPISNPTRQTASKRQGLTRLPRKGAEGWPARCGGDFRSPRKPAGPAFGTCGLARKARLPHQKASKKKPRNAGPSNSNLMGRFGLLFLFAERLILRNKVALFAVGQAVIVRPAVDRRYFAGPVAMQMLNGGSPF